jgi:L-amino acid N-acyltransferase YncA
MLRIRPATGDDMESVREIYNDAILNTVATFDTIPKSPRDQEKWFLDHMPRHPVIVAELDGRVVGWASLSRWSDRPAYADTAEVSVYVAECHRGKHIGHDLLDELIKAGNERGFHTLVSRIVQGSDASIRMHESLGFARVGVLREAGRKFGRLLDVTIMQIVLEDR